MSLHQTHTHVSVSLRLRFFPDTQHSLDGESAYLEYTFGARDFTDFIYRTAVAEQLTKYNETLIDEFNKSIEESKQKQEEKFTCFFLFIFVIEHENSNCTILLYFIILWLCNRHNITLSIMTFLKILVIFELIFFLIDF